ncbi:MAG: hypothetical protein JKY65_22550 [Planctomycetes bacterium]|nr:hypothetical protein [Planctomycetota bacterium]
MNKSPPGGSTVEDQFFLRIALKNHLLTDQQAAAIEQSLAPGQQVEELVLSRGLLDQAAVDRIRTAMAASQVMRLDALYAELLIERGLADEHLIEAAFKEQRRQQYRVRIGNLLLQRRMISPDSHREVISEVIRRLRSLGQDAYSSANRPAPSGSSRAAAHGSAQASAPPPPTLPGPPPPPAALPPPALIA